MEITTTPKKTLFEKLIRLPCDMEKVELSVQLNEEHANRVIDKLRARELDINDKS